MCEKHSTLVFYVNGRKVEDEQVNPEWTLLTYLRNKLRLCGTKLGCGEGGCGACTVMVSKYDRKKNKVTHIPVNACLAPVCSMHGLAVTTVEGIGSTKTKLHPVQERIAKAHGSQCGFCTPGIVMSMYTLMRNMQKPTMSDIEIAFQGNLCRCTGYRPIIEGYRTFTEVYESARLFNGNGVCGLGDKCCKVAKSSDESDELFNASEFLPYDSSQEPIFPPELMHSNRYDTQYLHFKSNDNVEWHRPLNLEQLLELKTKFNDAKIVVGNTEIGVEVKFKHFKYSILMQPSLIHEMNEYTITDRGIQLGAAVTLDDMHTVLQELINTLPEAKTRSFKAIVKMLHYFAGKQIRSVGSIGGNIMTGSPISDLNPIFMAAGIVLELRNTTSTRHVVMDEKFFISYRKSIVQPNEVLVSILIPFGDEDTYFYAHKQSRRRDDDIAIVNSAICVNLQPETNKINNIRLVFGGMAPTTVFALKTQSKLIGLPWNDEMLNVALDSLLDDLELSPSAPGGMIQYRKALPLSFFFRTYMKISKLLNINSMIDCSGIDEFSYIEPQSSQLYQIRPDSQPRIDTVGRPINHLSSLKQATGEAIYCDDMPFFENELYMALVFSTKAHANIVSIDATEASKMPNIVGFVSAEDVPHNSIGAVVHDSEVFVSKTVKSQGQVIGAILGLDQMSAQKAARKVKVEYEELQPIIITIEDAIKHESYYPLIRKIDTGNVDNEMKKCEHVLQGECRTGYQEHFYFETQCCVVVPKIEDDEYAVYISSQHPSEITAMVSEILNIPQNRVVTHVKRMGGGFGGKESRTDYVSAAAAVAAAKFKRPVRIMLDRDEDMASSGGRHPFLFRWTVGFDSNGKMHALDVKAYSNAGYSRDLSVSIVERALFHIENAYHVPHICVEGFACRTNLPSNTAFRGFGGPQGMFTAETIVRRVAEYLKKDCVEVSHLNLYQENDIAHYNQQITHCTLTRCWNECMESSQYNDRKLKVTEFNRSNRWKKRGISVVPTKFGISFTAQFLNQAGALIMIYLDGSVLLTHGGTEMGQGLHTKMIQVASKALGIPVDIIHISETATDKVPNTSATAASLGSDLNGMAVLNACNIINERLAPIKAKNPNGTWLDWVKAAYMERISLSTTGFYKIPELGYSFETNSGRCFDYFTYGVAVTEVEIDCLTGDHQVLRTDIVMDLGESINPAIDIGQIEGGFMQGYGLFVMEEMMYSPTGTIYTKGPGAYKIPGFGDIPKVFNVALLKGAPNPRAVYSSKAVGEPPLFLASSVLFAIREAIKSARLDAGIAGEFHLDAPATCAKIRMGCQDHITAKLGSGQEGVAWNVIP